MLALQRPHVPWSLMLVRPSLSVAPGPCQTALRLLHKLLLRQLNNGPVFQFDHEPAPLLFVGLR